MVVLPGFTWIDNPRSGGGSYATDGPSSILLHMTVSMGLSASYVAGHPYPPHFWANPYTGDRWQTISPDRSAFALYQPSVSNSWTNKKGYTLQTELVGVPEVNVETYTDAHCRWIGEKVVAPQAAWLASIGRPVDLSQVTYRSDSSGSASEYWWGRMGEAEWDSFNGLCQHSVVPYNDHWDCSVERLDRIAAYARAALGGGSLGPSPNQEFTVSQYDDIMAKLAELQRNVWDAETMTLKFAKKCRMVAARGNWWMTDFVGVLPLRSPDAVVQAQQSGFLDNDTDANGNPIPQGIPDAIFDTLVRYDHVAMSEPSAGAAANDPPTPTLDVGASLQQATVEQLWDALKAKTVDQESVTT